MSRSTNAQRSQRLNAAFDLLAQGYPVSQAAALLTERFGLSLRQAHRYLQEARSIAYPVPVPAPIVPLTVKISEEVAASLRQHARHSGMSIGDIVSRAVIAFLDRDTPHG